MTTVAVMKTKAETALADGFEALSPLLPGGEAVAEARTAAMRKFSELGLPHRRIEEWKYTDLRAALKDALPLAVADKTKFSTGDLFVALGALARLELPRIVFVNGAYRKELSSFEGCGADVSALGETLRTAGDKVAAGLLATSAATSDAVLALNTAQVTDGAVIRVRSGTSLEKPLLILHVQAGSEPQATATRNVVSIGAGAKATLVEAFVTLPGANAEGQTNAATEIVADKGAHVSHLKLVTGQARLTHLANWIVTLEEAVNYRGFHLTAGAALARSQIFATYKGQHSKLDLSGVFLGRGSDHIDTTLVVDHAVPHCESRELFKGVLDDRARGIFQGKVIVRPDAQKSDGKQMAQVLMLSPDAEFDSKPELEIYADDVVCGHGSTAAEIDEDLLFYCRSRGIPEAEARAMLIESFIGEALDKVEHEGLREAMAAIALEWLAAKPATKVKAA